MAFSSGIRSILWYFEEGFFFTSLVFMILQGFRDETFGMPLIGVIIYISWAFLFSFYIDNDRIYLLDQVSFFLLLIIFLQVLLYGPKEFFAGQRLPFYGLLVACTVPCLGLLRALIDEEGRKWTHNQLFYGFTLITSILFVQMLLSRGDSRGQHMMAAVCKCAGMLFGWLYQHPAVISWLCVGSLMADVAYIYLLYLCLEKPQDFHQWRNYLLFNSNNNIDNNNIDNQNYAGPFMNRHANGVVYNPPPVHPPIMADVEGDNNKNTVEMQGGVLS